MFYMAPTGTPIFCRKGGIERFERRLWVWSLGFNKGFGFRVLGWGFWGLGFRVYDNLEGHKKSYRESGVTFFYLSQGPLQQGSFVQP